MTTENKKFRDKLYDLELETGQALSIFVYSKDDWNTKQKVSPFYENVFEYERKDVVPLFEQVEEMIMEIEKEIKLN